MMDVCSGLEYMHSHGIIHRDISSNNVIVTADNNTKNFNAKIIDLDISRFKNNRKYADTTIMGTAGFAAPEQFGFKPTNERADIYSMGVLMNVMLMGDYPTQMPYNGRYDVKRIINKCLEIDPQKRFGSVTALKRIISGLADERDGAFISALKNIPGFRSRTWWKMLLVLPSLLFILYTLFMGIFFMLPDKKFADFGIFMLYMIFGMAVPYLAAFNYKYYIERIRGMMLLPELARQAICLVFGAALYVLALFVFAECIL